MKYGYAHEFCGADANYCLACTKRFMRRCKGRMQYATKMHKQQSIRKMHRRRGVWHTPGLRGFAMSRRRLAVRFTRRCKGRMQYATKMHKQQSIRKMHRRRGVWHTPGLRGFAMSRRRFAVWLTRWCTARMSYPPTYMPCATKNNMLRSNYFGKTKFVRFSQIPPKLHLTWEKPHRT